MARTYIAVEIDTNVTPKGWNLMHQAFPEVRLIRKLRKGGFFANFGTLEELERHSVLLAKSSDGNDRKIDAIAGRVENIAERCRQPSSGSKESSSDLRSRQTGQEPCEPERGTNEENTKMVADHGDAMQVLSQNASPIKRDQYYAANVLASGDKAERSKPGDQYAGIQKSNLDSKFTASCNSPRYVGSGGPAFHNWHISGKDGSFIPVTEVPYTGADSSYASNLKAFWLFGYAIGEQKRICIDLKGWKLEPTVEGRLAIHVETARKVWIQLGKPEASYEQTIRSVLVYMELYCMVRKGFEGSKSVFLQWLQNDFCHWQVKPNENDFHESILLMNQLNLGATHATAHLALLTSAMKSSQHSFDEESDADSDGKLLSFKRIRRNMSVAVQLKEETAGVRSDVEPVSPMQTTVISSELQEKFDSDEEPLILKRATMSKKRGLDSDEINHEYSEILSCNKADMDHVALSSRLVDLKRRKSTLWVKEDLLVEDLLQQNETTGCGELHGRIERILKDSSREVHASHKQDFHNASSTGLISLLNKLGAIVSSARAALDCVDRGGSVEEAETICSKQSLRDFSTYEVALTKYETTRFFPSASKQKEVAERINSYAHDGDTVVEFCCQTIDYFSLLKERLASSGKKCNYKRYMKNASEARHLEDWLSLEKKDLPTGSKLVMCLSFSFSIWGDQANQILDHALELKPKLIILIAPLFTRRLEKQTSYDLVWDDSELLQNEVMWPWGLMGVSDSALEEKGGIPPVMFLWSRTDWTTKHRQVASQFGHVRKQGRDNKTGLIARIQLHAVKWLRWGLTILWKHR